MEPQHLSFSVPGTALAAATARRQLVAAIRNWGFPADSDALAAVELMAGELLSNAVQHAGPGAITLTTRCDSNVLRLEVSDSSRALPRPRLPSKDDEHGRGLFIVSALADRYDVEPTESGKRFWAEASLQAAPGPQAAAHIPLPRR
ncbi:ATP-binding protein [Streptomyces lydicus]|uniref:ATP-binding protein n=1 Tax=Streptomyces lydicus TaxID=47763 RepID=A0A3Q9K6P7_9ACTN|nr:ATP-binding protein [Streptomyces lydicus]AZS69814.1 ATP-binding protein [Streptomyces lydicus]